MGAGIGVQTADVPHATADIDYAMAPFGALGISHTVTLKSDGEKPGPGDTSEFVVVMALLVGVGLYLMYSLVGPDGNSGQAASITQSATQKVVSDPD